MNRLKYSHAKERFEDAITILVKEKKDIRHRLFDINEYIMHLQESELPYELLDDFREVKGGLQKYKIHKTSKTRSITEKKLNIRNKTGEKIAYKVWNIYHELHFNEEYN